MKKLLVLLLVATFGYPIYAQQVDHEFKEKRSRSSAFEEIDFEGMMRRYFGKDSGPMNSTEGIYSVSCVVKKTTKRFLLGGERVKVVERKDNYARVALLKDWPGTNREYLEVSLNARNALKYPIIGEVNTLSEGAGLIYKHYEPGKAGLTFSMISLHPDLLEGVYSEIDGRKLITYTLSYIKIYPKENNKEVTKR
jgi:hypothetical protein